LPRQLPDGVLLPSVSRTSIFRALGISPNDNPRAHLIMAKWRAANNHNYTWAAVSRASRHWHNVVHSYIKIPGIGSPSEMAALLGILGSWRMHDQV